eukprot:c20971_g1_i1 orf=761-2785(+)
MQNLAHEKSKSLNATMAGLNPGAMPEAHLLHGHSVLGSSMIHSSFSSVQAPIYSVPAEESLKPSQSHTSISSTVLSSGGSFPEDKILSDNTSQSSLKERDYIGLADVSSKSLQMEHSDKQGISNKIRSGGFDLNLETDLRLGLAPPEFSQSCLSADHTFSSISVKGSTVGAYCKQSGASGFCGRSLSLSDGHGAGQVTSANQGCDPYFSLEASAPQAASSEISKEQIWAEGSALANQTSPLGSQKSKDNWVKIDAQLEKQIHSDNRAPQDLQTSFQQGTWSGNNSRLPTVDSSYGNASDKRPPLVPEISPSPHLWQSQLLRNADSRRHFQSVQGSIPARSATFSSYPGTRILTSARNGVKRGYFEAMADARFNTGDCGIGMYEHCNTIAASGNNALQLPEEHVPQYSNPHPSSLICSWAAVKPPGLASWQTGFDQSGSFGSFASATSNKPTNAVATRTEVAGDGTGVSRSKSRESLSCIDKSMSEVPQTQPVLVENQQLRSNDPPSQKDQVVGWPPVRSFRKNTIAAHPKPACDKEVPDSCPVAVAGNSQGLLYVKVNMDGVPIGRKIDLNVCNSYEGLSQALEEMFQRSSGGQAISQTTPGRESTCCSDSKPLMLLTGSDYVLTYEDKDGDCMLVGDVPWHMFVNTVRRLRIMKGSEATGLAPRRADKPKCPP